MPKQNIFALPKEGKTIKENDIPDLLQELITKATKQQAITQKTATIMSSDIQYVCETPVGRSALNTTIFLTLKYLAPQGEMTCENDEDNES